MILPRSIGMMRDQDDVNDRCTNDANSCCRHCNNIICNSGNFSNHHLLEDNNNGGYGKKRRLLLYYLISLLLLFVFCIISGSLSLSTIRQLSSTTTSINSSATGNDKTVHYGTLSNATNPFIVRYERALVNDHLRSDDPFIPLLYENGKLLCRRKHKSQLSRYRTRYFVQMVRAGLASTTAASLLVREQKESPYPPRRQLYPRNDTNNNNNNNNNINIYSIHHSLMLHSYDDYEDGLPILVMDGDDNGCTIQSHRNGKKHLPDAYAFPRLTWSDLSSKHTSSLAAQQTTGTTSSIAKNNSTTTIGQGSSKDAAILFPDRDANTTTTTTTTTDAIPCNTISMPSYETYKYFHRSHRTPRDWENTFASYASHYPWESKLPKAVWRGSTTYEGSQYTGLPLQDTPRGRLVLIGGEHSHIMDVGFHKIIQQYANEDRVKLAKQFTMKRRMHPMDMMKYRAIIDIDGNNWSSRFGMLLCSNSIVIKIDPDFVEYFYGEHGSVKPNIHYLPASLDNITQVVSYSMDVKNNEQMKDIVRSANDWCKQSLSKEGLVRDALLRLDAYAHALDLYQTNTDNIDNKGMNRWRAEWKFVKKQFMNTIHDFVDCNAWSIIDLFTYPTFAGL